MTRPSTRGLQAALVRSQAVIAYVATRSINTSINHRSSRNGQQFRIHCPKSKKRKASPGSTSGGKRKKNWGHAETVGLIEIWGSTDHQAGFEGMTYNSRILASVFRVLQNR